MDRLFAYLVRFTAIVFGYAVAIVATSLFLHILIFPAFGFTTEEAPWAALGGLVVSVPFVALLIGYYAFLPAAVAIVASEIAGWRGFLFHAFAGAALAAISGAMFRAGGGFTEIGFETARVREAAPLSTEAMLGIAAAGMVGGIAYWMVAGRGAGSWRGAPED